MASGIKFSYEEVKSYFELNECKLLEKNYKNARTKMKYICKCGNESKIVFDSFKRGNRCKKCGTTRAAQKQKITQEQVENYFKLQGCKLIDEYKNNLTPMKYICKCGNKSSINWNNFKTKDRRCKECGIKKRSGSNHYDWKPDRVKYNQDNLFKQKSYKLIKMVLNCTGRVKNKKSSIILGYTYSQLQDHITSHPNWIFVKDKKWHIDHIFPIKAFLDHGITDLSLINALDNLRPLDAKENLCKNCKYDKQEFLAWLSKKGVVLS
jgi:hypothetical protein